MPRHRRSEPIHGYGDGNVNDKDVCNGAIGADHGSKRARRCQRVKKTSLITLFNKREPVDVVRMLQNLKLKDRHEVVKRFARELRKPGSGVTTMDFCTLGMLILDDIYHPPPRMPDFNVLGGAGTYAALGARLFRQPPSSELVGWVVHKGMDFSTQMTEEVASWTTDCRVVETPNRLTTRGINIYNKEGDRGECRLSSSRTIPELTKLIMKDFEFVTPKIHVDQYSLSPGLLTSKTYHLNCSPARCIDLVKGILELRDALPTKEDSFVTLMKRPIFVWEPLPASCTPSELPRCYEALKYVDVVSPNLVELFRFFDPGDEIEITGDKLRDRCNRLLTLGFGNKPCAVVVRLGEAGCCVAQMMRHTMMPAYHKSQWEISDEELKTWTDKTVDLTGAGNAFLGGYCIGLLNDPHPQGWTEFEAAAIYGSVAASFAIEQVGMPRLSYHEGTKQELWNGEVVRDRLNAFEKELKLSRLPESKLQRASLYETCQRLPDLIEQTYTRSIRKNEN